MFIFIFVEKVMKTHLSGRKRNNHDEDTLKWDLLIEEHKIKWKKKKESITKGTRLSENKRSNYEGSIIKWK